MSAAPAASGSYATVREMYAMRDAVLVELKAMEERLTKRIDASDERTARTLGERVTIHDALHNDRDSKVDEFMRGTTMASTVSSAEARGRSTVWAQIVFLIRTVNEFRWLIAAILVGVSIILGNIQVDVGPRP